MIARTLALPIWLLDAPLAAYMALIWYLSSQPHWPVPELWDWQDKLMHAGAFGVLAALTWLWAARRTRLTGLGLALFAWAWAAAYGCVDEWHQSFVPGRVADPWDALADAVGAAMMAGWLARQGGR